MLLGTLGANLLGNVSTSKGTIIAAEGTSRAGYESKRYLIKDVQHRPIT